MLLFYVIATGIAPYFAAPIVQALAMRRSCRLAPASFLSSIQAAVLISSPVRALQSALLEEARQYELADLSHSAPGPGRRGGRGNGGRRAARSPAAPQVLPQPRFHPQAARAQSRWCLGAGLALRESLAQEARPVRTAPAQTSGDWTGEAAQALLSDTSARREHPAPPDRSAAALLRMPAEAAPAPPIGGARVTLPRPSRKGGWEETAGPCASARRDSCGDVPIVGAQPRPWKRARHSLLAALTARGGQGMADVKAVQERGHRTGAADASAAPEGGGQGRP